MFIVQISAINALKARQNGLKTNEDKKILETSNYQKLVNVVNTAFNQVRPVVEGHRLAFLKKEILRIAKAAKEDGAGAQGYFNEQFRAHGVKKFFEIQRQEIKSYARHIRRHIEGILFEEWASGSKDSKSMLEIEKYAQLLRTDCDDRITAFKQQIARQEQAMEKYGADITAANTEWNNIGWMRREEVFAAFIREGRDTDLEREEPWYRWSAELTLDENSLYARAKNRYAADPGSFYVKQADGSFGQQEPGELGKIREKE